MLGHTSSNKIRRERRGTWAGPRMGEAPIRGPDRPDPDR